MQGRITEKTIAEKPFLYTSNSAGEVMFVNLLQVVRASKISNDVITLYMSDGSALTFVGLEVERLVERLTDLTLLPHGAS